MAATSLWPLRPLKQITSKIGSGATPRGGKNGYKAEGIALIRSLNVYDFSFTEHELAFIDQQQADELDNVTVEQDDILLNITGASVARCCMVDPHYLPARVNQHVAIVRVLPDQADARFVLYCINSPQFKSRLLALAQGGATREALTKSTIEGFEVPQPPLRVQQRISGILSAYDDLMENNTRRVHILEQMAQGLYREWFVHFRFPGHAKVKRVASPLGPIPRGWSVRRLDEIASVNTATIRRGEEPEDILYVDISSVGTGRIEKIEPMAFANAPGRALRIVRHGDTIWSCVRPNRKSFSLILDPPADLIVSTGFAVLTPSTVPFSFLHQAVTTDEFVGYLTTHATGAAYPAVTAKDFEAAQILVPDEPALRQFHEHCEPLLLLRESLMRKNTTLRRSRDLLLPKLISGALDVSRLALETA